MKNVVRISNEEYTLDQLRAFTTPLVLRMVSEYMADPNCAPGLWVCDVKDELTINEQTAFIALACINKTCQQLYDQYNWGGLTYEQHDIWNERKLQYNYITGKEVPLEYNCPA